MLRELCGGAVWMGCVWGGLCVEELQGSCVGKLCGGNCVVGLCGLELCWSSVRELWGAECMWSCVEGAVRGEPVWELPLPLVPTHSSSQVAHCSVYPPHPLHAPVLMLHLAVYSTIVQHSWVEWGSLKS